MNRLDLPCLKYIIERIEDIEALGQFRAFFCKALAYDKVTTTEQLALEYMSKVPPLNSKGVDMFAFEGGTGDPAEFLDAGCLPALSGPCCKYCKEILSSDYMDICKTCSRSGKKIYANMYEEQEYSLLKYAAQSKDNSGNLILAIGSLRSVFKSLVDVTSDVDSERPVLLPFTKLIYQEISKSSTFFSDKSLDERLGSDDVFNHIIGKAMAKDNNLASLVAQNKMAVQVAYRTVINKILQSDELSDETMAQVLDVIVNARSAAKTGASKNDSSDIYALLEKYSGQVISETIGFENEVEADPVGAAPEISVSNPSDTAVSSISEMDDAVPEQEAVNENGMGTAEGMTFEEQSEEQITYRQVQQEKLKVDDERELPLYIPIARQNYIDSLPRISDYMSIYIQEVVSKGNMIYEVVRTARSVYFIIYSQQTRRFYQEDANHITSQIQGIFASKAIQKITWQSFLSYSLLKRYGVCIQNIHSIFSAFTIENPSQRYGGYSQVMSAYVPMHEVVYGELTGSKRIDLYLLYMPYYARIMDSQSYIFESNHITRQLHEYFQEYMGISYLRSNNFNNKDYLFTINVDCRYEFSEEPVNKPLRPGYLLSYAINCPELDAPKKKKIFETLFMRITMMRYFRKYNIQICNLGSDNTTLFCEEYAFDALKTFIRMALDQYAIENNIANFNYVSDVRHVVPEGVSDSADEAKYPTDLLSAQDHLISMHDKVTVGNDRVRVSRPSSIKRQTETFPN